MKTIAVVDGAHYFLRFLEPILLHVWPGAQVTSVADTPDPDIGIFSVFGDHHTKWTKAKTFRILVVGEPTDFKSLACELVLDCKNIASFRPPTSLFIHLPFCVTSFGERKFHCMANLQKLPSELTKEGSRSLLRTKDKFCAFLYSQNVELRNRFYDLVCSKYKQVDALGAARGPELRSTDRHVYTDHITYNDLAVDKYRRYKFAICFENRSCPGYVTEKAISAMLARSICVYWGCPNTMRQWFNPKSYISVHDFTSFEKCIEHIMYVDQHDEAYIDMQTQPLFINNRIPETWGNEHFIQAIRKIPSIPT
jgi:hypothetical protein